jgi:NACHT domain
VLPLLTWLIQGAVGPALAGLPVTWAASDLAGAARRWFRRLRKSDGLSRIVAAAAVGLCISDAEFAAVRRLLETESTWVKVGRGTVEDLAVLIASRLPGGVGELSMAAGRAIAGGLLEFAVRDLEPEWFQQVMFARLDRLQADQAGALDQAMLSVHADLAALLVHQDVADMDRFTRVMSRLACVLDRLPPRSAGPGEVVIYLATLARWLDADPWPQDARFAAQPLTPAAIERKLAIRTRHGQDEKHHDADELGRRCARLVVLGGPGSGKTWLAKRTARLSAESALSSLAAGAPLDQVELPLYTTCARLFATPPGGGIHRAVVTSALGQLPDLGGSRVIDALRLLFEERAEPTLLVADSLDEASSDDDRIRQADTLPPSWRIVLTSRPASWNGQLAIEDNDPSRRVGVLQPLRYPDDVEPFIARWFARQPARGADLAAQLRDRPGLQDAATVPLVLAFYCIVGGKQPLPARRADLYAKVIRRMLTGRWRGRADRDPDPDACLETLRDWAWSGAVSDPVSGVGAWPDEVPTPRARGAPDNRDALAHVAVPLGPADVDTGMTQRRFVHRSLREHLVAEHVAFRMPAGQAAQELVNHLWYDPDWEYTAPASLAMHPERDQVLEHLIRRLTGGGRFPADLAAIDGCWEIRRFLARVAQESSERDWAPEAAEMIGRARLDLARSRQYHPAVDWPASNSMIIELLRGRCDAATGPWQTRELVEAVIRLDPTTENRAWAREVLLRLLASATALSEYLLKELLKAVVWLTVTEEDRARAWEVLLGLLDDAAGHWKTRDLAEAVVQLAATEEHQIRVREALLGRLDDATSPKRARWLADAVARLELSAADRARVRAVLLRLLDRGTHALDAVELAQAVARLDPSAADRARARETLLRLIDSDRAAARYLAEQIALLAGTEPDRAAARDVLSRLLESEADPYTARHLADGITLLAGTEPDRAAARDALFRLLDNAPTPSQTSSLAEGIARLEPSAADRARVRDLLLRLLDRETYAIYAAELALAVAQLDPDAEDLARARRAMIRLIPADVEALTFQGGQESKWLVDCVTRLNPTAEDRVQVRKAVLRLAEADPDPQVGYLAMKVARLDPPAGQRTQALEVLLRVLAYPIVFLQPSLFGGQEDELPNAIVELAVTERDKAWTREAVLSLFDGDISDLAATDLPKLVARLDPTVADRARLRQALLRLLSSATEFLTARHLAERVAELDPTVADLAGSDTWPCPPSPALLTAARRNSPLGAWLAWLRCSQAP